MKDHPDLLTPSLFALECVVFQGQHRKGTSSRTFSHSSMTSNFSTLTITSEATVVPEHSPDAYERASYYNGITGDGDHPELVYRSDYLTTPFPKPTGRFAHLPVKSLRGVFDTPLNKVWDVVGPKIRDIINTWEILWSSIDTARFFTHGPPGEEELGSLGPVVIWIGVKPGSTSSDTAHDVSQEILALLQKHEVEGIVVEWREAVLQRLAGPPLMRHAGSTRATHYVRRFLTPLLAVPLTTEDMENDLSEGTLTLWFHENKDDRGNPSNKVYGVSNCHVLRKNTTVNYARKSEAAKHRVRLCGMHRFQRGLDEITKAIADDVCMADLYARQIIKLQADEDQSPQKAKKMEWIQSQLDVKKENIADLEKFYGEVTRYWSNINLQRSIGYVEYAPAIKVDEGRTNYTADWAVFVATEAKVKDAFEGNVIDLGAKYSPPQLMEMLYPSSSGRSTFKYPVGRKLSIFGCASREDLAAPAEFDKEGQHCLMVGKDGNTTDLTVGRFSGLESFTRNAFGVESKELAIYNSGYKTVEVFSAKGDSGSLVWHVKDGEARIVGQLHSGENKGGLTSNHVTYCTPGWYLLAEIKKKFKHANFYRTTW
ncbi:hypothetical protein EDD15DRAFT_428857 [Pisolithus albus]|nr:hypothetical protein EDD15DRAFT_428857 [Pisolithus albus]